MREYVIIPMSIAFHILSLSEAVSREPELKNDDKPWEGPKISADGTIELRTFDESKRIVGGTRARPGEFPFLVSIQSSKTWTHFCGGTLIKTTKVLTACHCLVQRQSQTFGPILKNPVTITVHVGTTTVNPNYYIGQRRYGRYVQVHPLCKNNPTGWEYDFGIIITRYPFELVPGVVETQNRLNMTTSEVDQMMKEGTECITAGWGALFEKGQSTFDLMKVKLKLVTDDTCEELIAAAAAKLMSPLKYKKGIQMCTIGKYGGNGDGCQGDSGGPLICNDSLVSTVSWGIGCGRRMTPGVWARIDVDLEWILNTKGYGCYPDSGGTLICNGRVVSMVEASWGCGRNPGVWTRIDCWFDWIMCVEAAAIITFAGNYLLAVCPTLLMLLTNKKYGDYS